MRGILSALICSIAGVALCHPAWASTYVVNVGGSAGLVFVPQTLTIDTGDTVVFVNKGGYHNVVADDSSFRCARGCDGSPGGNGSASSSNWVASVTFAQPGAVGYFCEIHGAPGQGMYGTILVRAPSPAPAPASAPVDSTALGILLGAMLALLGASRLRRIG